MQAGQRSNEQQAMAAAGHGDAAWHFRSYFRHRWFLQSRGRSARQVCLRLVLWSCSAWGALKSCSVDNRFEKFNEKQWKKGYKALILLEYLLTHGPLSFADELASDKEVIQKMCNFHCYDEMGWARRTIGFWWCYVSCTVLPCLALLMVGCVVQA